MKTTILFILLTFISCSKDKTPQEQLPPATQIGANTAGCYINGELLLPKNGSQAIGGPPAYGLTTGAGNNFNEPIIGDDYSYIRIANLKDKGGDAIYLHINDMTMGEGVYNIGQSNGEYYMDALDNPQVIVNRYDGVNLGTTYYSGPNAGTITITRFDYPNGILSGIFALEAYNKDNPSDKIQITEGRFDLKFATLNH